MKQLSLDIETYSDVDLAKSGVYVYCQNPAFEVLLLGYAYADQPVTVIDLAGGEKLPESLVLDLNDPKVEKYAYNAMFERVCLGKFLSKPLDVRNWRCTMVQAAMLGLPRSLKDVGHVLGLADQKLKTGEDLVKYFCMPCKPTNANAQRKRNLPRHDPERWELFKAYNQRDVEVERSIRQKLSQYTLPAREQQFYELDQVINDRGVLVDRQLVKQAILCYEQHRSTALEQAEALTGLENPNSVHQLRGWLSDQGVETQALDKKTVMELLQDTSDDVQEVLAIRKDLAKTSIGKYQAIERYACSDNRVRGMFRFYGANRTGRFAGSGVQLHNLPRNSLQDLGLARKLLKSGDFEVLESLFGSLAHTLSELVRTAFIPAPGKVFLDADYSAIEARVLAWLAGETWRLDVFRDHGKIYEASASHMFRIPLDEITKTSPYRQKGKVSELACGYGGSTGALIAMGALDMGLTTDELPGLIKMWRQSNPMIVQFWHDCDAAAIEAVRKRTITHARSIRFMYDKGILFVELPSGRRLSYIKPMIGKNRFGGESITFEGIGTGGRWQRQETYGAKLVENITQAVARDILCEGMLRLEKAGYPTVIHVHDEVVIETSSQDIDVVTQLLSICPDWAKDLPLCADGFISSYFMKD